MTANTLASVTNSSNQSNTISVVCTRPLVPGESLHINEIEERELLNTPGEHRCSTCGMKLVLQNQYIPTKLLDSGGFGRTFVVNDLKSPIDLDIDTISNIKDTEQRVLKQFHPKIALERSVLDIAIRLFRTEARSLKNLKHEQIPCFYNYFPFSPSSDLRIESVEPQRLLYLVEEYIPGQNLAKKYFADTQNCGENEIRDILSQLLPVLKYIHKKDIKHRDIKPPNIICDSDGKLHLIDFGAVKDKVKSAEEGVSEQTLVNENSTQIATLGYSPPEQQLCHEIYPSSDIYSLAATCVSLLINKIGLELELSIREKTWKHKVDLNEPLVRVIDKMLSYKHSDRYQTAEEVIRALENPLPPETDTPNIPVETDIISGSTSINQPNTTTPPAPGSTQSQKPKRIFIPIALIALALLGGLGIWNLIEPKDTPITEEGDPPTKLPPITELDIQPEILKRMSLGEERLTKDKYTNPLKESAIEAFKNGNYKTAIAKFESSLRKAPNDPESLVYLNNAKAEIADRNPIKIAISIPLGTAYPIALEMLRGTAQIQNEVNNDGGIAGRYLQVVIMDDDNNPVIGRQIAQAVVQDPNIIAVIGSNTTQISRVTSEIYQSGGVVMVNPTSWGDGITGADKDYIFRAVSSPDLMAQKLAQDVFDTFGKSKIAICYNDTAQDNMSFKNVFVDELLDLGGSVLEKENGFDCQLNSPFFNANSLVGQAKELGAEGLLLAPHINDLEPALEIARANEGELSLFSSTSLYTGKILIEGQEAVNGLTFYAPWHPDIDPNNEYYVEGNELWDSRFNWRTATTLEATLAVTEGLKQASEPTRNQLQQVMINSNFVVDGISPTPISFSSGDREGEPVKVQVQPGGEFGYDFVLQNE